MHLCMCMRICVCICALNWIEWLHLTQLNWLNWIDWIEIVWLNWFELMDLIWLNWFDWIEISNWIERLELQKSTVSIIETGCWILKISQFGQHLRVLMFREHENNWNWFLHSDRIKIYSKSTITTTTRCCLKLIMHLNALQICKSYTSPPAYRFTVS